MKKLHTWKWVGVMTIHMIFFLLSWMALLIYYGWDDSQPYLYRANASYWWYWINFYIHIRIQIKILLPLMEKHVREDKPGYLDPYIERFKAWLRERISYAGGKAITS